MTDYLEEALEHTRALLREIQRLERPLTGRAEGDGAPDLAGGGGPSPEEGRQKPGREGPADGEVRAGSPAPDGGEIRSGAQAPGGGEAWAGPSVPDSGYETERRGEGRTLPLLDQLERLERAASAWSALPSAGTGRLEDQTARTVERDGYPRALSAPGKNAFPPGMAGTERAYWRPVNGGPASAALQTEDETGWAERADRAFRRDSRRYDGGFFLY